MNKSQRHCLSVHIETLAWMKEDVATACWEGKSSRGKKKRKQKNVGKDKEHEAPAEAVATTENPAGDAT